MAPTGPVQMTQTGVSHLRIPTQITAATKDEPREQNYLGVIFFSPLYGFKTQCS